uniref:Mitochondrial nucleoid factor 1 n=1 Tax=Timema bartmani TaxID=61472 RepID=A0A7R9EZF5_9NEOP|nr:unnamed protein product [Timema bartmani]
MSENESDNEYTVEFTEDGFVSVAWGRNPAPPINSYVGKTTGSTRLTGLALLSGHFVISVESEEAVSLELRPGPLDVPSMVPIVLHRPTSPFLLMAGLLVEDLGEYIREQVTLGFSAGAVTKANDAECERIHASLKRLVDNHHSQLYKRVLSSSSSGLSVSECHSILTTEFLEKLEEEDQSFVSKLFDKKEK